MCVVYFNGMNCVSDRSEDNLLLNSKLGHFFLHLGEMSNQSAHNVLTKLVRIRVSLS